MKTIEELTAFRIVFDGRSVRSITHPPKAVAGVFSRSYRGVPPLINEVGLIMNDPGMIITNLLRE